MVTRSDLRAVLDLAYDLGGDLPDGHLPAELLGRLGSLVGCDVASCTSVDHSERRLLAARTDDPAKNLVGVAGFRSAAHQHPAFAAYRAGRLGSGDPVALSDLVDARTLRRMPLYVDYYRPRGTADQLLCVVGLTGRHGTVLAFNRSRRGFAARDRQLVELVAPHVSRSLARVRRSTAQAAAHRVAVRARLDAERGARRLDLLTGREREVARWVTDGATDREIARGLGISHRTVQKHLEQVYRKLEVGNRTSLAAAVTRPAPGP